MKEITESDQDEETIINLVKEQNLKVVANKSRDISKLLCHIVYEDNSSEIYNLDIDDAFLRNCFLSGATRANHSLDIGANRDSRTCQELQTQNVASSFLATQYLLKNMTNTCSRGLSCNMTTISLKTLIDYHSSRLSGLLGKRKMYSCSMRTENGDTTNIQCTYLSFKKSKEQEEMCKMRAEAEWASIKNSFSQFGIGNPNSIREIRLGSFITTQQVPVIDNALVQRYIDKCYNEEWDGMMSDLKDKFKMFVREKKPSVNLLKSID